MRALARVYMRKVNASPRRESDIMLTGTVLEVPEHEFDDDDWDDEELETDELDVELDEEGIEPEHDEDF
jgi:hypothetical protein